MFFHVKIQPEWKWDTVSAFNICCETDLLIRRGERLAAMILEIVKIPFCPMEDLRFWDDAGEIPYSTQDGEPEQGFIYRRFFLAGRETQGRLRYSYRILPRVQPEGYRSSPYFDLVAEKGGVNGSGATFLIHPAVLDAAIEYQLSWDLSRLPEGCRGIWSLGAEDVVTVKNIPVQDILFSVYAAGKIRAIEKENAGFYWFDKMPVDAKETADIVTRMFLHLSEKFHDKGGDYRVFTRRNHFPGGGGTAFVRSYLFAYGTETPPCGEQQEVFPSAEKNGSNIDRKDTDKVTLKGIQSLLAHEMVHNWPTMLDEPPGAGTWYVEGSAEYYSVMVQLEMGLASLEEIAADINEKAATYYENPYMDCDNISLGPIYWEDLAAQRLPYARGMIYLANLDAQIRRASAGRHSLLDIELALLELSSPTYEDFLRIGSSIAGFDLEPGYLAMQAGGMLLPDPDAFGGLFTPVPCRVKVNRAAHRGDVEWTDEERDGYRWTVRNLRNTGQ